MGSRSLLLSPFSRVCSHGVAALLAPAFVICVAAKLAVVGYRAIGSACSLGCSARLLRRSAVIATAPAFVSVQSMLNLGSGHRLLSDRLNLLGGLLSEKRSALCSRLRCLRRRRPRRDDRMHRRARGRPRRLCAALCGPPRPSGSPRPTRVQLRLKSILSRQPVPECFLLRSVNDLLAVGIRGCRGHEGAQVLTATLGQVERAQGGECGEGIHALCIRTGHGGLKELLSIVFILRLDTHAKSVSICRIHTFVFMFESAVCASWRGCLPNEFRVLGNRLSVGRVIPYTVVNTSLHSTWLRAAVAHVVPTPCQLGRLGTAVEAFVFLENWTNEGGW